MKMDSRARKIFQKFPRDVKEYFQKLDQKCQKHGITLKIGGGSYLYAGGKCGGYFSEAKKTLAVAIGSNDLNKIISTLIHEENHCFNQYLNPRSIWYKKGIISGHQRFSYYLAGQRIYKPEQATLAAIKLEYDCERKTLRALKKWQKYVNLKLTTKQANAYILAHWHMLETGKWPSKSFFDKKILKHCPDSLVKNPRKVPESLKMAFKKYL